MRSITSAFCLGVWLALVPGTGKALPLSEADLYLFPLAVAGPVDADVRDPARYGLLREGVHYRYSIQVRGGSFTNQADPGDPASWDVVNYRADLSFLSPPVGGWSGDPFLLVLLGFRQGLSPDSAPADVGYLRTSFLEVGTGRALEPLLVRDGAGGQIPDGFGRDFVAFAFEPRTGAGYRFDYSIAIRAPLANMGRDLAQFHTAFAPASVSVPAPEPSGLVLLAVALAAISARRSGSGRFRRGRSGT
jgi:hypothetical protein